ncbi:hypothetical protein IJH19_00760, partial [Candidatus Saccharibacteria bacterium]|nr:hypothetical protein [Candidatus Saccharibacteria bacterium]
MTTKKAIDESVEKAAEVAEAEIKNSKTVDIEGEPTEARKADVKAGTESDDAESKETEEHFAKSGKKSKKHIEEVKAEEARQERKAETKAKEAEEKPKGAAPIVRPKIERRGKKYQEVAKLIDKDKVYTLK